MSTIDQTDLESKHPALQWLDRLPLMALPDALRATVWAAVLAVPERPDTLFNRWLWALGTAMLLKAYWRYSLWVNVILHELGHLLAGSAVGLQWIELRVGPWRLAREEGRVRLRLIRDQPYRMGGVTKLVPRSAAGLRWRWAVLVLGGPLTNLSTCLGLVVVLRDPSWLTAFLSPHLAALVFLVGGELALAAGHTVLCSLRPRLHPAGEWSDAVQLWELLRAWPERREDLIVLGVQHSFVHDGRPRTWPWSLEQCLSLAVRRPEDAGHVLPAMLRATDEESVAVAKRAVEAVLALCPEQLDVLPDVLVMAGTFYACRLQDAKRALELLARAQQHAAFRRESMILVVPALKLLRGQRAKALEEMRTVLARWRPEALDRRLSPWAFEYFESVLREAAEEEAVARAA